MTLDPTNPQPGIYDGVPCEVYHDLPCLSSGGITTLDAECPAVFRHERDAPDEEDGGFDIGTAAHLIFLEPHLFDARVERLDVDSFRSRAAREARDIAREEGKTPLKVKDYETVLAMREALVRQVGDVFRGGTNERTYVWRDPRTGVLLKARPDYVRQGLLIDYKTTSSANPRAFRSRLWDNGHHLQAFLYLQGHELLTGERAQWRWIVQATKAPHLVTAHKPTPSVLGYAEMQVRAAVQCYAECLAKGHWPGYGDAVFPIELPSWATYQLQERIDAGDFKVKPAPRKKALTKAQVTQSVAAFSPLNGGVQ